jgi:hypothetical protein
MLRTGEIVKTNVVLADEYLRRAVEVKWLPAQLELVEKLREERDPGFFAVLEAAADGGHLGSIVEVARRYRRERPQREEVTRKRRNWTISSLNYMVRGR